MQNGWRYLRVLVAIVLAAAAIAKFFNMTEIHAGTGLLSNRWLLSLATGVEAGVAVFLLLSNSFWFWAVTAVLFLIFSGASTYAIASGQDCNCISQKISPKMMLPFDLTILAIVCWVRPAVSFSWNKRLMFEIAGSLAVGILVAGGVACYDPAETSDPVQFLLADMSIEKRWPLDASLHPDLAELDDGNWMVLVVRRDCEHCRELVEKHFADPTTHRPNERTAIFIAGASEWTFKLNDVSIEAESRSAIKWPGEEPFVASPAIFILTDGNVVSAGDGQDSDRFMDTLFRQSK